MPQGDFDPARVQLGPEQAAIMLSRLRLFFDIPLQEESTRERWDAYV